MHHPQACGTPVTSVPPGSSPAPLGPSGRPGSRPGASFSPGSPSSRAAWSGPPRDPPSQEPGAGEGSRLSPTPSARAPGVRTQVWDQPPEVPLRSPARTHHPRERWDSSDPGLPQRGLGRNTGGRRPRPPLVRGGDVASPPQQPLAVRAGPPSAGGRCLPVAPLDQPCKEVPWGLQGEKPQLGPNRTGGRRGPLLP